MNPRELADKQELIRIYKQRLAIQEKQAAGFGNYCPPYIIAEIEEAREKIAQIEKEIANYTDETSDNKSFVPPKTTILFLAADPSDITRLRLGQELREIQEKLQLSKLRDQFDLKQRLSVRPVDISQAMLDVNPRIVHFSGHGAATGELCFENELGEAQAVRPDALSALFELVADRVECVILNACFSEIQAEAISNHVNYVIGMNRAISDKAAISFAIGLYQALGAGETIEKGYQFGCVQIRLQGISEHLTPVLIKKKKQT